MNFKYSIFLVLLFIILTTLSYYTWYCSKNDKRPSFAILPSRKATKIKIQSPQEYIVAQLKQYNLSLPISLETYIEFQPKLPHIIYIHNTGRMGNQMFSYSKLWGIYRKRNIIPIFNPKIFKNLKFIFPNLKMLYPKDVFVNGKLPKIMKNFDIKWVDIPGHEAKLDKILNSSRTAIMFKSPGSHSVELLAQYKDDIFEAFTLKSEYQNSAQFKLQSIKNSYKLTRNGNIQFVGIHVRRSDKAKRYGRDFVPMEYFLGAMNLMRNLFFGKDDVIFVIVTDNYPWAHSYLNGTNVFFGDNYIYGKQELNVVFEDFALLVNCNHTIIEHGTFGFYSSVLAGGTTIAADVQVYGRGVRRWVINLANKYIHKDNYHLWSHSHGFSDLSLEQVPDF